MVVILNEVKNLIISTESIREILRLSPQNDIATESLGEEGWVRGLKGTLFHRKDKGKKGQERRKLLPTPSSP